MKPAALMASLALYAFVCGWAFVAFWGDEWMGKAFWFTAPAIAIAGSASLAAGIANAADRNPWLATMIASAVAPWLYMAATFGVAMAGPFWIVAPYLAFVPSWSIAFATFALPKRAVPQEAVLSP